MDKMKGDCTEAIGCITGYITSFLVFTIILYFILILTHRINPSISKYLVPGISCGIVVIGTGLKKVLG
ncbi:hypothetical protein JW930_00845 [Candidatus Woesearchaeota archaeon]|nr:hypothetical protein [Candidatus Woesearchaeota archaeon]